MDEDRVRTVCEACHCSISFPGDLAGSTEECPKCGAYVDVPDFNNEYDDLVRAAQKYQEQVEETDRQNVIAREQLEQMQRHLDAQEQLLKRDQQLAGETATAIERWNQLAVRFENLISCWESERNRRVDEASKP